MALSYGLLRQLMDLVTVTTALLPLLHRENDITARLDKQFPPAIPQVPP
jgi:hypothetical protein